MPKLIHSIKNSNERQQFRPNKEDTEDVPLILPFQSFMQFNQANNPLNRYNNNGTYISSCSSEFSKSNLTSKNTISMEYSMGSNSLTSSGFTFTGHGQNKVLRDNFEKSVHNFLNIPEEEDDDDDSLVVLTELNDNPNLLEKTSVSPALVLDVVESTSITEEEEGIQVQIPPAESTSSHHIFAQEKSLLPDEQVDFWRPIEHVVVRKRPEITELLFDLNDLCSHTPTLLNDECNEGSEPPKPINQTSTPSPAVVMKKTSKHNKATFVRKSNAIPPLHPSSRIFSMQKNQVIVEEHDYTQGSQENNSLISNNSESRRNNAIIIQSIYRGWKCRLSLLQKVR